MRIVVAMDSFKGSLTTVRACEIFAEAIASIMPDAEIIIKPMADGGGGAAQATIAAGNAKWITKTVMGLYSISRSIFLARLRNSPHG